MGIVFFSQRFQFDIRRQYYWNDPEKVLHKAFFNFSLLFFKFDDEKINDIGIETKKQKEMRSIMAFQNLHFCCSGNNGRERIAKSCCKDLR